MACQTCISPCVYGRKWLQELGMTQPARAADSIKDIGRAPYLPRVAKIKMCLNRGC